MEAVKAASRAKAAATEAAERGVDAPPPPPPPPPFVCRESDDGAMIVFEDDVLLESEFTPRLTAALAQLRAADGEWDVLLLGAIGCVHPDGATSLPQGLAYVHGLVAGGARKRQSLTEDGTVHVPFRPFGTHAYVISRRGAAKLLEKCPKAKTYTLPTPSPTPFNPPPAPPPTLPP